VPGFQLSVATAGGTGSEKTRLKCKNKRFGWFITGLSLIFITVRKPLRMSAQGKINLQKRVPFAKGNKAGVGHGRPRKYKTLEALIDSVVTDENWEAIIKAVKAKAMKGDKHSADLLMDRKYGRPVMTVAVAQAPVVTITHSVITLDQAKAQQLNSADDPRE
jgi:hypothetical protein